MRRPIVSLILAGVVAGILAAPASAATVRVVDDDGKGSPASCDSAVKAFKTVQAGVDAASAGDTVLVCPGTYPEQVAIDRTKDGLRLRGAGHWTARIAPSEIVPKTAILEIEAGADRVSVSGLNIRYRTTQTPIAGSCDFAVAGIMVSGDDARIRGNLVDATGPGRLGCGLVTGILVGTSHGASPSAAVRYNVVQDFGLNGIIGNGLGLRLTVFRNVIRFHHKGLIQPPNRRAPAKTGPAGSLGIGRGVGISIVTGSSGVVRENTIEGSLPGRGPLSAAPDALYLGEGIQVGIGSPPSEIRGNRIYRTQAGILSYQDVLAAQSVDGPTIAGNIAISGEYGIVLRGLDAQVEENQAQSNVVGVWATEGSAGNVITGNELRYNFDVDCADDTAADAGSVANSWSANRAITDVPSGICVTQIP